MMPVTQAALAGSASNWRLRRSHTLAHAGPARYGDAGTGLAAFAAPRSPAASARNAGPVRWTMRTTGSPAAELIGPGCQQHAGLAHMGLPGRTRLPAACRSG